MHQLLKKLNYKDQSPVLLRNLPRSWQTSKYTQTVTEVVYNLEEVEKPQFALFFVTQLQEVEQIAKLYRAGWKVMPPFGLFIPKEPRSGTNAILTAIRVGQHWAVWVWKVCGWSLSMKTGARCACVRSNTSRC